MILGTMNHGDGWIPLSRVDSDAAIRNAAAVSEGLEQRAAEFEAREREILTSRLPFRARLKKLYRLVDDIGAIAAPYAACKRKCSACCHMATLMSEEEAQVLGAAIGRKPVKPPVAPVFERVPLGETTAFSESFYGTENACTFLKNNECSIYENRPLACRSHINMAATAESCTMDVKRETAMLNLFRFDIIYSAICESAQPYDIREFFPKKP